MAAPYISVVIPVFNEVETLPLLYDRVTTTLSHVDTHEIIFVNDGSQDGSLEILKGFAKESKHTRVISFSRNFGHQTAVTAGLQYAKGDAVVIIDGDLQDPPEIIPEFIQKWQEGYDVVYGIRKNRKEGLAKRSLYYSYYRLLKMFSEIDIPLDSGDCCLMSRRVVSILNSLPERNRFVRGLRSWIGFKQVGMEYDRDKRYAGEVKYTSFKLLELAINGIISFSGRPLRTFIFLGLLISVFSVVFALAVVVNRALNPDFPVPGWSSILAGVTFFGGLQLMMMGLLGEYIIRIHDESKRRPLYILDEVIGFENDAPDLSNNTGP